MKLGLESMTRLLAALGDPHKKYLKVQVAGTNGKGSVCAFLDAICNSAGMRTGVTTSPHLVSITERVRISGRNISEPEFAEVATRVREAAERLVSARELDSVPTYFEQVTAIALLAFADAEVELAILETGLGGRLDATTATGAEIVAITRIDHDHQNYLGDTLEQIAKEKAAIIRKGSRVVIGAQSPEAMAVILARCRDFNIIPQAAGKTYVFELGISGSLSVPELDVDPPKELGVTPGLKGRHQVENAHTAIMVAETLVNDFGICISEEQVKHGIENAQHPGRLEFRGRFLFDGAHNLGGAKALREFLDEFVDRPITMIFGMMREKDLDEISKTLFPKADILILTKPDNTRAFNADEIAGAIPEGIDRSRVVMTRSVGDGLEKAVELSSAESIILVTGSLYLVGEAQKILEQNGQI